MAIKGTCKGNGGIVKMFIIDPKDIKSYEPLELKRKYGNRTRTIHEINLTKSK